MSAIRVRNLVELRMGHNIILPTDRTKGRIRLWIPGEDVKNGSPIDMRLPESTSGMIIRYLDAYRPHISEITSDWLFPNPAGVQRNVVGFSRQLSILIDRHAGLEMHAHLFRHLALKLLEEDDPNSAELGRRLLAHKNIATTLRAYSEGKTKAAHTRFEQLIEAKRTSI